MKKILFYTLLLITFFFGVQCESFAQIRGQGGYSNGSFNIGGSADSNGNYAGGLGIDSGDISGGVNFDSNGNVSSGINIGNTLGVTYNNGCAGLNLNLGSLGIPGIGGVAGLQTGSCSSSGGFRVGDGNIVKLTDVHTKNKDMSLDPVGNKGDPFRKLALRIADSIKKIFYILASLYFLIITIKLIVAENTEEALEKFKKGVIWISIGIIVMNIAIYIVNNVFLTQRIDEGSISVNGLNNMATEFLQNVITPFIKLLEIGCVFLFILVAIIAFFTLITSNGDEEKAKKGKMTILYAIIGFILVKIAGELVFAVYGDCRGNYSTMARIFEVNCRPTGDLKGLAGIIAEIINWMNSFVALAVIIMILYAGAQIIFSGGDEEKVAKGKKSVLYIVIGIAILLMNYLILTFLLK